MKRGVALLTWCVVMMPVLAHAQDFGIAESAETIAVGTFTLRANPMFVFPDNVDTSSGLAGAFGYGFTNRVDAQVKVALYDSITFIGGAAKFQVVRQPQAFNLSLSIGGHFGNSDFVDHAGVDLTALGSYAVTPRLDIYGALDLAFNRLRGSRAASDPALDADLIALGLDPATSGADRNYRQILVVPGVKYSLRDNVDLVAEVGFAVNDESSRYLSVGVAYNIR